MLLLHYIIIIIIIIVQDLSPVYLGHSLINIQILGNTLSLQ